MKPKDLALLLLVVPSGVGLLHIIANDLIGSLIWLGYAWAGYYRYNGGETAKRICLCISVFCVLLYISIYTDDRASAFILWIIALIADVKLLNKTIE